MALRTEIVRWDTGDKARTPKFIEEEELRIGPDIARIGGDKKRKISDQTDASCMGVLQDAIGLTEQKELRKTN